MEKSACVHNRFLFQCEVGDVEEMGQPRSCAHLQRQDKSQTDILPSTICVKKKSRRATKNPIVNPVLLIWMIVFMITMTIIPLHFGSTEADVQQNTESCRVSPSIQVELIIKMTVVFIEDK